MLSRQSNNVSRQLFLLLFLGITLVTAFGISDDPINPLFHFVIASSTAPSPSSSDSSPVAAIIMITEDPQKNIAFKPETTTVTQGAEIFIGNNSSSPHSITSGTGPDDPLSGKLFRC